MATDGHSFCFMSYLSSPPSKQHHSSTMLLLGQDGERVDSGGWELPVQHLCCLQLSLDFSFLIQNLLAACKYDGVRQQKTVGEYQIK